MIDSWRPRKLEPGLAHTYSKPSDLITSTMKSDPERSMVKTSIFDGVPTSASGDIGGGAAAARGAGAADAPVTGFATSTAAPAAAPFRKSRRSTTVFFLFAMTQYLHPVWRLYHK